MPISTDSKWVFGRVAPMLLVRDFSRAVQFYEGVLGMTKTFENGHPPSFAIFGRDQAEIQISVYQDPPLRTENVAHLLINDAQSLYEHLVSKGVAIIKPLRDADYEMRTFVFADPDGNRIDVGQYL